MSRKGENIYKRRDGRWEARYVKGRSEDGRTLYGYCYASNYHAVRMKLLRMKGQMLSGSAAGKLSSRRKFANYCDEWLELNRLKVKESTYAKYYVIINNHIKPKLGGYPVSTLSSSLIGNFGHRLIAEDALSPKTAKDILVLLKGILRYTCRQCTGEMPEIDILYPKEEKKEMRVLTRAEQESLIRFLMSDMDHIKFGVLLSLLTGLRVGEICALKWRDISVADKLIRVSATMQRIRNTDENSTAKTKVVITDPKSDSSVRLIPLTDFAAGLCARFSVQNPAAFVLTGSEKCFIEPRTLQYRLARYAEACGLKGVHYHTLRHSFATRCVEVGFEIKSLSEILGHSSPKITLERYVHSSIELKRVNMNKLAQIGY